MWLGEGVVRGYCVSPCLLLLLLWRPALVTAPVVAAWLARH